jgi:PAS domain-containing protein
MKRFLEKLLPHNEQLINIFDSISDLVFILERKNNQFIFVFANNAAKNHFGFGNNIIGKQIEEVLPTEIAPIIIDKYNKAVETKQTVYFEQKIMTKKKEFYGEIAINPIIVG